MRNMLICSFVLVDNCKVGCDGLGHESTLGEGNMTHGKRLLGICRFRLEVSVKILAN